MKNIHSHFWYTKSHRNGILFLGTLILVFQVVYFFVDFSSEKMIDMESDEVVQLEKEIDSLRKIAIKERQPKVYKFNPNFISDFKGYQLGMSTQEIDRLHNFRKQHKFVNSKEEFQQVTRISDSLLAKISPLFKFPEWVLKKQKKKLKNKVTVTDSKKEIFVKERVISTPNLNKATKEDLMKVDGVGEVIAARIIKYRSKLGGFSEKNQLNEVWSLEQQTAEEILKVFTVLEKPNFEKVNVNTASFKQVLKNPYIDYELCKKIFEYRDEVAELQDISELRNIKNFPQNKYARIVLYLKAE